MQQVTKIAIAGLGTVGESVIDILRKRKSLIQNRIGGKIKIVGICAKRKNKKRKCNIKPYAWFDSPVEMLQKTQPDIAIELIGGSSGDAYKFVNQAIKQGCHVVTANKAMLAERGNELAQKSEKAGVTIAYEAAIGGGIPIVKSIREAAGASDIYDVSGILNGTCNFILSEMAAKGSDFKDVLKQAQKLGYAEADPSFDIGGMDAAHKIALLAALSYGCQVDLQSMQVQGIENITQKDISYAKELGYCIKLLAEAKRLKDGVHQSVAMRMLPMAEALSHVGGSFNAIDYRDAMNERITLVGHGAGGGATATAVLADIIDLAKGVRYPLFGVPYDKLKMPKVPKSLHEASYYIRLDVKDVAGVLSRISKSFFKHSISVETVIQHGRDPNMPVSMVFTTHPCLFSDLAKSLAEVNKFDFMLGKACVIQMSSN